MKKGIYGLKIATIIIFYDEDLIHEIKFVDEAQESPSNDKNLDRITEQINDFLNGKIKKFNLKYPTSDKQFERRVLDTISSIPYGETRSYKQIAISAGYPNAYRAVGTVCKNNKLPLIIPCHRVVKSNGDIGEYAGGKELKKYLINLEESYSIN